MKMKPLNITIVQGYSLPVPPLRGGAVEKAWYSFGREFAARGHNVTHISRQFEGLANDEVERSVRHIRVKGAARVSSTLGHWMRDFLYTARSLRVLPPADILITHTFWLPLLERRKSRGIPYLHVARYPKGQLKIYPKNCIFQTVSNAIRFAIIEHVPRAE